MIAGARVEVAPYKKNPMDFVLWKPSDADTPGWDSPWGRGRPGWHIECSAMAQDLLGTEFDIHGGGTDLLFPHHENECAQSCALGHGFARIWMHNEMLQVEGKKMSKSLGNFFTVRDLLDQGVPGEVIRMVFLMTHYRKPMDWTAERVREAEATLRKWRALTAEGTRTLRERRASHHRRALGRSEQRGRDLRIAPSGAGGEGGGALGLGPDVGPLGRGRGGLGQGPRSGALCGAVGPSAGAGHGDKGFHRGGPAEGGADRSGRGDSDDEDEHRVVARPLGSIQAKLEALE